jgi:hypothetical protein
MEAAAAGVTSMIGGLSGLSLEARLGSGDGELEDGFVAPGSRLMLQPMTAKEMNTTHLIKRESFMWSPGRLSVKGIM